MCRLSSRIALFAWLLLAAPGSMAEVHRWVDEQGQVHYEDRSRAQSTTGARSYKSPGNSVDDHQQRMEKTRKLINAYQTERQQQREAKEERAEQQERRKRNCLIARDNLEQYRAHGSIYRLDDNGERVYYSEQEREALLERARANVQKWCG
jgi:cell division protein FtsN